MRITDVRCWLVEGEQPRWPFRWRKGLAGSGDGTPADKKPLDAIIRVDTDEGIYGAIRVPAGPSVMSLVERRLKSLVGENPLLTERLWWLVWEIDRIEEIPGPPSRPPRRHRSGTSRARRRGCRSTRCWAATTARSRPMRRP